MEIMTPGGGKILYGHILASQSGRRGLSCSALSSAAIDSGDAKLESCGPGRYMLGGRVLIGDRSLPVTDGEGKSRYAGKGEVLREEPGDLALPGIMILGKFRALGTRAGCEGSSTGESVPRREGA